MTPPTILSSKTNPVPGSVGSKSMTTWPYWPLPPLWRMNLPSTSLTFFRMVSRKATCGLPTLASTLNSRFIRSTRISRCSSPMPAMMVCPVSWSERTRKVGSSSCELLERDGELVLVGLGLGLDGDVDDRIRELHRLEDDRLVLVGQRVPGARVLEADGGADVAREHLFDLLALVGVHLEQSTDPLPLVLGAVVDVAARLERAGVHPEEGEPADIGIGRDLERERRERLGVRRAALGVGVVVQAGCGPRMAGMSTGLGR